MSEPAWVPIGGAVQDVGAEVAYQEFTANVSVSATSEATANTVVTAPAFNADGSSQYLVEFNATAVVPPAAVNATITLVLFVDGVAVGSLGVVQNNAAQFLACPVRLIRRFTPAAGARTLSIRAFVSSSSGTVNAGVGGSGVNLPGFIRITKVPSAAPGMYGLVPPTAIGTVLPASPVDGQEFILTDSLTAPTYTWHLRYVAAKASNKWVFVGGSPARHYVGTGETSTSTTYTDLTTNGPTFTVPVTGEYLVRYAALVTVNASAITSIALFVAGVQQQEANSGSAGVGIWAPLVGFYNAIISASQIAKVRYKTSAGTVTYYNRAIEVTPVAIGG